MDPRPPAPEPNPGDAPGAGTARSHLRLVHGARPDEGAPVSQVGAAPPGPVAPRASSVPVGFHRLDERERLVVGLHLGLVTDPVTATAALATWPHHQLTALAELRDRALTKLRHPTTRPFSRPAAPRRSNGPG
jgi:hypothetical protein